MIKRFINKILFLALVTFFFVSCERDDICPPGTPTTPFLIIEFFDVAEQEENKSVQGLSYVAENSTDTVFLGSVDSIAIPLNTNQNSTKYQFIRNTNNANIRNADTIQFLYEVNEEYVNRACSFKAVFRNLSAARLAEEPISNNWIRNVLTETEPLNVVDEQNTHIFILH